MNYTLTWKPFNVCLGKVTEWLTANAPAITGLSAGGSLIIHFVEVPSEEVIAEVNAYWDGLTEQSTEATCYMSKEQIEARRELVKTNMIAKSWDNLSTVERKIVMELPYTREELF